MNIQLSHRPSRQQGVVLAVALILLVVLTLLGISAMDTTLTEMKLSSNNQEKNYAFSAGEAGLRETRANFKRQGTDSEVIGTSETPNPSWNKTYSNTTFPRSGGEGKTTVTTNGMVLEYKGTYGALDKYGNSTKSAYFEIRAKGNNSTDGQMQVDLRSGIRQAAP